MARTISWQQLVMEADPDWHKKLLRPTYYYFSNGRKFVTRPDIYTATGP